MHAKRKLKAGKFTMQDKLAPGLYVVGTPLGNLGDMSPRGLETLAAVDFIAAEDTRVSLKLLNRFGIKKPLVSYYEHNLRERGEQIAARILAGESCAVITDAGMPCISDPGEDLVRLCAEKGIAIAAIPGPTALATALAVSGLPTGRFAFEGFLSVKRASRFAHLEQIREDPRTLVFYEAPHKLAATLRDMLEVFGDRQISLCRELTKLHEEVLRTTLGGAVAYYEATAPRGEYVLVVAGAKQTPPEKPELAEAVEAARKLMETGMPASAAAREAAKATGHRKGEIYKMLVG
jgi:16S rRNA (cytidine1402-2'-O)-methyltransferase